jgi:hypothetical protein
MNFLRPQWVLVGDPVQQERKGQGQAEEDDHVHAPRRRQANRHQEVHNFSENCCFIH